MASLPIALCGLCFFAMATCHPLHEGDKEPTQIAPTSNAPTKPPGTGSNTLKLKRSAPNAAELQQRKKRAIVLEEPDEEEEEEPLLLNLEDAELVPIGIIEVPEEDDYDYYDEEEEEEPEVELIEIPDEEVIPSRSRRYFYPGARRAYGYSNGRYDRYGRSDYASLFKRGGAEPEEEEEQAYEVLEIPEDEILPGDIVLGEVEDDEPDMDEQGIIPIELEDDGDRSLADDRDAILAELVDLDEDADY